MQKNTLLSEYPDVASQWDREKNSITPEDVSPGSHKKLWWVCDLGHSWEASVSKRALRGQGCPYCSGRKAIPGYNDLATTHPAIARQWGKGNTVLPNEIKAGSNKKIWWVCDLGHQYQATPNSRTSKGTSCPYCSGHRVLEGFNDLGTTHPDLCAQFSPENDVSYTELSHGSSTVVSWECHKGHTWEDSVVHRTNGRGCPYCAGKKVCGDNSFSSCYPDQASQWHVEKNSLSPDQVSRQTGIKAWFVCDKGHEYYSRVSDRSRYGCPRCSSRVSAGEQELLEMAASLVGENSVAASDRSIIAPYELDIYIPDRGIAIEYNGLYWHTESAGKDRNYHYNKWRECKDAGIQLITIWEDEWRDKKLLIEKMIAHKLGVSDDRKVFARKTTVVQVESSVARKFCDTHHIQGAANGSTYLGLKDDSGELVAVSVWRKNKDVLYLERYCTSTTVIGGMGKLLKAGKTWARDNSCYKIVTFADHQISDGNLYEKLGFTKDKELSPDYKYVIDGHRKHKFGYRLKRFQNDPELLYREGYTETQLAQLNGLERVWDCGKTRYVMQV